MKLNWKRTSLVTLLMVSCFSAGVVASNGIVKVEAFLRPDFKIAVDGKEAAISTPPLIYNDRSYLPLADVAQLLDATVNWHDRTKTIYITPRFAGQPENPSTGNETYPTIRLQQPFAYKVGYLGGTYALLTITDNQETYFRVRDLALMGIDTRGLAKSKEQYTGELYVKPQEVRPLWKQYPSMQVALEPVVAGVTDESLKQALMDYAQVALPTLSKSGYLPLPKGSYQTYFIDAIPGDKGLFAFYVQGNGTEPQFLVVTMEQNKDGEWFSYSMQGVDLDGLASYYKD